ncbi:beta-lactamase [Fictibacillus macauensis ZFHKF-1]|uniref:Beta-lactamase n=1 Tax=Fictibacillus macauensis ZFHKF-1 TaxID=1196324 RepID=I8J4I6_9BACL|nr:serine hydrolase [Fictibacillus macauensis]EIT86686.1 beta-lactamase [Fictibacillus macauensis ZFHKF-1]
MFELSGDTLRLIRKSCTGKKHIKLTVGYITDTTAVTKVYNEDGEVDSSQDFQYEIGSITKTFTTSLLSKYVFEKKVSIHDSIQKYINGLEADAHYPSFLRLATHSSGYSARLPFTKREYWNLIVDLLIGGNKLNEKNPLNMDPTIMKRLIEKNQLKEGIDSWKYSNFGISLIGYALGQISGNGYWDLMNSFLQNELGLSDTYLGTSHNILPGYNKKNQDCGNWSWHKENLIAPAGAISSTAADLLKYAQNNFYEDQPYFSLCHRKHGEGTKKYDMGLGWFLLKRNNHVLLHGGGTGCFRSFLGIDKEKKVASVVLANYRLGRNEDEKIGMSLLESLQQYVVSTCKQEI